MATGALIGALRVTLGLDSAQFESGIKRAAATSKTAASSIQSTMGLVKASIIAFASVETIKTITEVASRALDYASSLAEVAQQLGITAEQLQVYRYAGSQVGIANDVMDTSLAKLTKTIGEAAAGSKAQAETFHDLGIAVQDVNGRVYTAGEIIPKLADALAKVKDPATRAHRNRAARQGRPEARYAAGGRLRCDR